jgi:hypothetical protein
MVKRLMCGVGAIAALSIVLASSLSGDVQGAGECGAANCVYLPLITKVCGNAALGQSYGTSLTSGPITDRPAEQHPDLNLSIRGYVPNSQAKQLVFYGGGTDLAAPRLGTLFNPSRLPTFNNTYDVYDWNWATMTRGSLLSQTGPDYWPVTLLGLQTSQNEVIHLPERQGGNVSIDPLGRQARVLYAETTRITLKYTSEDNVVSGYTLHIENICVDPDLLSLYQQWNAAGRSYLPALTARQPIGRALGTEIRVTVRDTGTFGDPRSCKDNWVGYGC